MVAMITSAKWTGSGNPTKDVEIIGLELKQNAKIAEVQFKALFTLDEDAFIVFESTKTKCKARALQVSSASQQAQVRIRSETDQWTAWADIA